MELRTFDRGEILFRQGDAATELFVVVEGRIAIATQAGDGREAVVAVLEDGGLFGELALFDDAPRSADGRALTDSTVAALGYEPYAALRPGPLWVMVRLLAERLRQPTRPWPAVFLDVPARTAKRLLSSQARTCSRSR